jgi:hypothetical protein
MLLEEACQREGGTYPVGLLSPAMPDVFRHEKWHFSAIFCRFVA